jgi:acetolactate synthase-1/3 small subunit
MPHIIRMRVFDRPGVLDRVTGLIRRNGINIKTITSGNVAEGASQITISLGGNARIDPLVDKLREMASVRGVEKCTPETHIILELMLARFTGDKKHLIEEGMTVLREESGLVFAQYVADPVRIDAVLQKLQEHGIVCIRGGALGVSLTEGDL